MVIFDEDLSGSSMTERILVIVGGPRRDSFSSWLLRIFLLSAAGCVVSFVRAFPPPIGAYASSFFSFAFGVFVRRVGHAGYANEGRMSD